jgi:long-subunit fatty acid transport protein
MRRAFRVSAAAVLAALSFFPRIARATSVEEFPDNGSEQEGRGGAWVARASDPLATFYNPAGLAGQPTRLTLQANFTSQHTCFTRVKALNDLTQNDGATPGGKYPQVCSSAAPFPDPQLAFTYRVNSRVGIGIAILAPSADGDQSWPSFVGSGSSAILAPQRYLLMSSNTLLLTPTIGVGWEVLDGLRIGAAFIAGTAPSIDFVNASPALDPPNGAASGNDIRNELKAKDYFIPGFTLGTIWSPAPNLDVAGWYKWMSAINAKGDLTTETNYFTSPTNPKGVQYGDTAVSNCNQPAGSPNVCGGGNNASVKVPIPMEAKLGVRWHQPRPDIPYDPHLRDPMSQDVFDIEANFTWANDSAFDYLQIRFPADPDGTGKLPANPGIPGATIPPNADVQHHFRDVFGVRLGGDYNILPDQLAIRAGAFFETQAADSVYQNIDFDGADRFGIAAGGTYRIHVGAEKKQAIEFMLAYGHVFFGTLNNDNPSTTQGVGALTGVQCTTGSTTTGVCPNGTQAHRTPWPVNLGTITSSINVINVGASFKF